MTGSTVNVKRRMLAEQIHVGLPETGDRADIFPIALKTIGKKLMARVQNGRNDIFSEVIFAGTVGLVRL